jgi:hypothetical protein
MSRSLFLIVFSVLRIAIRVISRGSRLLITVLDIVDDGVQNGSVDAPEWFDKVRSIADYLDGAVDTLKEFPQTYGTGDEDITG